MTIVLGDLHVATLEMSVEERPKYHSGGVVAGGDFIVGHPPCVMLSGHGEPFIPKIIGKVRGRTFTGVWIDEFTPATVAIRNFKSAVKIVNVEIEPRPIGDRLGRMKNQHIVAAAQRGKSATARLVKRLADKRAAQKYDNFYGEVGSGEF